MASSELTLMKAIGMAKPIGAPTELIREEILAGFILGWLAGVVIETGLPEAKKDELWQNIMDKCGIEGVGSG